MHFPRRRGVANILPRKSVRGYTQFRVAGLPGTQLAKLVAFPTIRSGVVPAYETVVMNLKEDVGPRSYVDARTGRILMRSSIVHNLNQGSSTLRLAAAESYSFTGEVAATDAATPAVSDPNFARAAEFQVFRMRSNIDD